MAAEAQSADLEQELSTLLEVALEQGGAQRARLILCQGKSLSIEAETALEGKAAATTILESVPVDSSQRVPLSLIRYAQRTKERVILGDATVDFHDDLNRRGFSISNPSAKNTCGCGSSFSM